MYPLLGAFVSCSCFNSTTGVLRPFEYSVVPLEFLTMPFFISIVGLVDLSPVSAFYLDISSIVCSLFSAFRDSPSVLPFGPFFWRVLISRSIFFFSLPPWSFPPIIFPLCTLIFVSSSFFLSCLHLEFVFLSWLVFCGCFFFVVCFFLGVSWRLFYFCGQSLFALLPSAGPQELMDFPLPSPVLLSISLG